MIWIGIFYIAAFIFFLAALISRLKSEKKDVLINVLLGIGSLVVVIIEYLKQILDKL